MVLNVWSDGSIQIGYWLRDVQKKAPAVVDQYYQAINKIKGTLAPETISRLDSFSVDVLGADGIEQLKSATLELKNQLQDFTTK